MPTGHPTDRTGPPTWQGTAARGAGPSRRRVWPAAWPVAAVFTLSNAATPLYVLWQRDIGFSKGTLTVVFAFYIVGLLGSLLVSGVLSDRLGRKPVLLPALALGLAACALFATADSVAALIVARLLTGIAVGAAVSAGMAAVADVAGADRRRLAALLASCAMVLGAGLGPLLAGVLADVAPAPARTVFAVETVILVSAVVTVLRLPVPRRVTGARGPWARLPRVPREARTLLLTGVAVFGPGITATSFVLSLGPSLLADVLGTRSGTVAGVTAFVMFLAATGAQAAVHRLRRATVLAAGAVATVAGMGALTVAVHASSAPALYAAAVLAGAGQGLGQLGGLSLLGHAVPPERLAEANAALNAGGYLLAGTLPVAAGYLSDAAGPTTGTTVFAAVLTGLALTGGVTVAATRRQLARHG
ncbi:MFS transporter [Streptomyces avicenniae]|uniref:MFS transporter n=1 Tax=Streptomyces avicenniae TaxID=500153 RepID=UPI000A4C62D1|nr:MFS transporter [Streptomyces avicenniae]